MRFRQFVLAAALVVGCSGAEKSASEIPDGAVEQTSTTASTTTEAPNRPPNLRVVSIGRAEIGQRLTEPILGFDPDGDDVAVGVGDGPLGFAPVVNNRGRVTGFEWEPTEPGEWLVEVTATDPEGLQTIEEVRLVARQPRSRDMVLALGDSVAAGFGRDRSDFVSGDDCFRSEADAYGILTHRALVEVGSLTSDSESAIAACSGASVENFASELVAVTGPTGTIEDDRTFSQLEWASELNPTIITLTLGVEDVGLFDPEVPVAEPDTARLEDLERGLGELLVRLVTTTDAHLAVTTYYNPIAADPVGVEGCEGECFFGAYGAAMDALNEAIVGAVDTIDPARVSLVHLDGDADVWEAGNAAGPDALRDGLGPLQSVVDRFTGGSFATCADDGSPDQDLISSLDCLHPNTDGHREIAARVTDELLSL